MQNKYGVTSTGFVPKRLDVIVDELHSDLSKEWGVNTRQDPNSLANVLITNFADRIAELWEVGQDVYNSMYPFSAEGVNLDNAVQYSGVVRNAGNPSIYPVHIECLDGTFVPKDTVIKSTGNPETFLYSIQGQKVSRSTFNAVQIRVLVFEKAVYSVAIDGDVFNYTLDAEKSETEILKELAKKINSGKIKAEVKNSTLFLEIKDPQQQSTLTLSENLTVQSVTGILNFRTEENGDIFLPVGVVTEAVSVIPGMLSVCNKLPYIAGSTTETDEELRRSYLDKIFSLSSNMRDSIRSAILENVQGVKSCVVFENMTGEVDSYGRYPHSVEVVVDGGDKTQIAQTIFNSKAAGINTYGSEETPIIVDGEQITVRFNRPEYVYVWFKVILTVNPSQNLPTNYIELIRNSIKSQMNTLESGVNVVQQKYTANIYRSVSGIGYIEIPVFYNTNKQSSPPQEYKEKLITLTQRQKAVTDDTKIEVVLNG